MMRAIHFEQRVAQEKDTRTPTVQVGGQAQVLVHRERREGDIGAVDVVDQVAQDDQRQQPPRHLQDDFALELGRKLRVHRGLLPA
jgi:hypothetical protein